MTVDILSKRTNTLPSGFKITFTVGRIVKDKPHSLHVATDSPAMVTPSPSLPGSPSRADGGADITMTHENITGSA